MPYLVLFEEYTREDVHSIFASDTRFTPQSGTWGLHGIVPVPHRPGDFIFFVTFGQRQGEHTFDEGITATGVLSWQSQPRQHLQNSQIQQFINHDELKNTIYLFLRTEARLRYTYLGRLKYLSHDAEREHPVYFQWQLLDWPPSMEVQHRLGIVQTSELGVDRAVVEARSRTPAPGLILEERQPYNVGRTRGTTTRTFRAQKLADYAEREAQNRELGRAGEVLVINYEQQRLTQEGRVDLVDQIRHVAEIEGDGAGYDVLSFETNGAPKYIEVKTTSGSMETAFYMSANELEFARQHPANYYLYRVYDYDAKASTGKVYIVSGVPAEDFDITPTNYRVRPR